MAHRKIEFHPAALAEAEAARYWYAERSPSVARAFIAELAKAVDQVAAAPSRWPQFTGDTRRYVFPRFPFSLVYRFSGTTLQIIAVAHAKRRPGYWQER
jgi:plasmid stabilization system protein ParE